MFSRKIPYYFLCLTMLVLTGVASAQQLVSAKITAIEGQVEIRRYPSDQPVPVRIAFKVDDRLSAGDTIITGKNGRLILGLTDGSQAVIAPKTTVVIKDLSQSPRTLFEVIKGKTRIQIEKLGGQPNPYRVNTPTAVIAVRGTIFDVLVEDNETEVFLHEGEVAVTNLNLPNQPVFLTAGQTTRVFTQRPPNPPGSFKPGRNDGNFRTAQTGRPGQDNGRIADTSGRNSGRGEQQPTTGERRESARSGNPSIGTPPIDPSRRPTSVPGMGRTGGSIPVPSRTPSTESGRQTPPTTTPKPGDRRP